MRIPTMLSLMLLWIGGCTVDTTPRELPPSHPAQAKAPEAKYTPPPNVLGASPDQVSSDAAAPAAPVQGAPVKKVDSLPDETKKALEQILKSYEEIRAFLAQDKLAGIAEAATELAAQATKGAGSAPESLRADLKGISDAAQRLKHAEHVGLEDTRKAFGDLSRSIVRIVAAAPVLTGNRKVFSCPMWKKGYAKWIQIDPKVANPYQGTEMLDCGGPSEWKE